jgi:dipeptidyl aminopeptidase/acylaminoacyl peptidase
MASFYHYVVPGIFKPNFFNSENGQFRMSSPYFEQPLNYVEASPLYSVGKIKVPLLSWSGKDDRQIEQSQNKAFYLALRRMGNEHVMLIYPGEGHIISSGENQQDLTKKIVQWFGHHLKGLPLPQWAKPDFNQ